MAPDLDLRKLRYFVVLAEELNFGRAAQRLHIAQPVLSRQIRAFEHELGVSLFSRGSSGTALTAAGTQLLEDGRFMIAESKALRDRLCQVEAATVTVKVGVVPGLLATAAVKLFETVDPSYRAEVTQVWWAEQALTVESGKADVVYAREPIEYAGLGTAHLLDEPRDALLSIRDPLVDQASITLADLASRRLVQDPRTVPEWRMIADAEQRRASARKMASTVEEKLEMVAAHEGFAVLPRSTSKFYRRPDVRVIPIEDIGPSRVTLIWDPTVDNSARDAFVTAALACRDQTV
jgi:DNA-binding transcriptional LysR family regulator